MSAGSAARANGAPAGAPPPTRAQRLWALGIPAAEDDDMPWSTDILTPTITSLSRSKP